MGKGSRAALVLALGMLVTPAFAGDFCSDLQQPNFFRERALDINNRMAFENPTDGALGLKTGLCWWHSRFQRDLVYLAVPRPLRDGEKPMSKKEIEKAMNKLIAENSVVE